MYWSSIWRWMRCVDPPDCAQSGATDPLVAHVTVSAAIADWSWAGFSHTASDGRRTRGQEWGNTLEWLTQELGCGRATGAGILSIRAGK